MKLFFLSMLFIACQPRIVSPPPPSDADVQADAASPCDTAYDYMLGKLDCHPLEDAGRGWVDFCAADTTHPNLAQCVMTSDNCATAHGCYR